MSSTHTRRMWRATACLVLGVTSASFAQQETTSPEEPVTEETIVVTASKRETTIESIPASILAIPGESMRQAEINSLEQLSQYVPNVLVGDGALTTSVTIRGMGSQPERGFEQSVALFIDGVYMPRSRQYRSQFLDVNRVEILRGPQALLFGLNATAGAVSVVGNRTSPGTPFHAEVAMGYEQEFGSPRVTTVIGGSPSDKVGLRLAAQFRDAGDFYLNEFDGADENGGEESLYRLSGVWKPGKSVTVDLAVDGGKLNFDGDFGEQFGPPELNQLLLLGLPGADDGALDWRRDMDRSFYPVATSAFGGRDSPGLNQNYTNVILRADWKIKDHTLTGLLGYSGLTWDSYADTDASALPIFVSGINENFDQQSIELRWASPLGRAIDYMVGFYAHDNELHNDQPNVFEPTLTTDPGAFGFDEVFTNASFSTRSELWSLFAAATWHITETVRLTGGARYSAEDKHHERRAMCVPIRDGVIDFDPSPEDRALFEMFATEFVCGTLDGFSGDRTSTNLMPELAVEWDTGEHTMWYAKYSDSAKSGGFAAALVVSESSIEYEDERARSLELGRRSLTAGGKVRFNFALFNTEFDDLQLNAFNPITGEGFVTNAGSARSRGVELDARWFANETVSLNGALGYLNAKYESFPNAPCPISLTLAGAVPPCDASGKTMPRSPEFTASLGVDVHHKLRFGWRLLAGVTLGHTDDYLVDAALEPALAQDSYTSVGARVGLESSDGQWGVHLVGTNLTNETILNDSLPFLSNIGYLQEPRKIWLTAAWRLSRR